MCRISFLGARDQSSSQQISRLTGDKIIAVCFIFILISSRFLSKEKLQKEGTSALISDVWQKPKTVVEPGEDDLLALLEASFDEITVDSNQRYTQLQGNIVYS